ncbi:hypothetical protein LPJ57_007019, partial [Coemansia sp. RSA 486]
SSVLCTDTVFIRPLSSQSLWLDRLLRLLQQRQIVQMTMPLASISISMATRVVVVNLYSVEWPSCQKALILGLSTAARLLSVPVFCLVATPNASQAHVALASPLSRLFQVPHLLNKTTTTTS